ncbi:MAG TPA: antitoxin Xre-like helix-turn-helix domain-containing protein [Candidatus Elarobacter sp.]|jgi:hypothetical protein
MLRDSVETQPATELRELRPVRKQAATAIRAFFRIAELWKLSRAQSATLLAASDRSVDRWKGNAESAELTRDQLERISYVLGIYAGLHAILAESPLADTWVHRANADFGDGSPLQRMLAGNVGDLAYVRHYVDEWRVGW